ncbi:MAG: phosphotransferase [Candidatus Lokiarchaeota archaeon]|nr:phosphotransferase [Candidatus Lokiarchaeota archaeon]
MKKNSFKKAIQRTYLLDEDQKLKIFSYLENLPDGNRICHGDLHVENIIVSKNKNYVLDWSNAYSGNPNGDVARTYYGLKYGLAPSDEYTLKKSFIHRFFFKRIKSLIAKTYVKHYIKLTGISLKEIRRWDLVVFAARLHEPVPLEYDNILSMIKKELKRIR